MLVCMLVLFLARTNIFSSNNEANPRIFFFLLNVRKDKLSDKSNNILKLLLESGTAKFQTKFLS